MFCYSSQQLRNTDFDLRSGYGRNCTYCSYISRHIVILKNNYALPSVRHLRVCRCVFFFFKSRQFLSLNPLNHTHQTLIFPSTGGGLLLSSNHSHQYLDGYSMRVGEKATAPQLQVYLRTWSSITDEDIFSPIHGTGSLCCQATVWLLHPFCRAGNAVKRN